MIRLVYNFFRYNPRKVMTIRALFLSGYYRMLIFFVPVGKLRKRFGEEGTESPETPLDDDQARNAYWISNRLERVARRTPWQSKCFVRALVAQRLLQAHGLASTMYLGVGKNEEGGMIAHAWVRCGGFFITGGTGEDYATVAKFTRWPKKQPAGE